MTLVADFNPNVSVPFSRHRQLLEDLSVQAGVVGAGDFKVVQRGAGANMSVDVPAGQAWVEVTTGTRNGLAHIVNDATANVAVTASHATLPRIDQVVLQYNDSQIPTGSGDVPTLTVLAGTATAGAQAATPGAANYRAGAAALGNDRLRLADILVPAASTSVTTANIVDRRSWARGAYFRIVRNSSNYTIATTSLTDIDATNVRPRIECSGVPLRVTFRAGMQHSVADATYFIGPAVDAALVEGSAGVPFHDQLRGANVGQYRRIDWDVLPSAGSHLISIFWATETAGTLTANAAATTPLQVTYEEILRPIASNT